MNLYVIINFRGLNVNTYGLLFQGRTGFLTIRKSSQSITLSLKPNRKLLSR